MAPRTVIPVNRDPAATEAPLPANPAAFQQIIDFIVRNRAAHPPVDNTNYAQDFISFDPPAFDGSSDDIEVAYEWIEDLESIFKILQFEDEQRVRSAVFRLKGHARYWWKSVEPAQDDDAEALSWQEFKDMFFDRYCPETVMYEKEREFVNLRQGNMTLKEYGRQFLKLSRFAPELVDTQSKMAFRFVMGLRKEIRGQVAIHEYTDYHSAFLAARIMDECMPVRSQPGHGHGPAGRKRKHRQIS